MAVREIDCNGPGITRVGAGRGFFYRDSDGTRIEDNEVLDRIAGLAIPPAWKQVWICSDPQGHIQATGVDAKGRRQYVYHREWQSRRSREKHKRVLRFARQLPDLRARVDDDLDRDGMPKERVLGCAVRLLELGCFRTGGESYAQENGSYGLATLQKQHVHVQGHSVVFDFPAKSGQRRRFEVVEPNVVEVLATLKRRRAPSNADLLAYRNDDGAWTDIRSEDINAYLRDVVGEGFTAKDFRTWAGTVLAALAFADQDSPETDAELRRAVAHVGTQVADHLGNTPAVARSAYIDPVVVERFEADETLDDVSEVEDLEQIESQVLDLIEGST
jgi:DNA topoisomerase IB